MRKNKLSAGGFSLIELMVTIAIVGILASIAYPSYEQYVKRAARAEAMAALLDAANRQEQYFVDNRAYTTDLAKLAISSTTENGYFTLATTVTGNTFVVTATAAAGPVKGDSVCSTLTINEIGVKGATGSGTTDYCWER
ncbi:Type IV pilus biogenesis protein PilE [Pseudoalteromonas luteoviolacea B = ATCC 29581]|nr:Type IV pilus biogenesis protein PilE [Pseudoalteromonas luteoviolacea B = ATCC 29581]